MQVMYKYNNPDNDDLVCELTKFFDKYKLDNYSKSYWITYLWNDLCDTDKSNLYNIAFRLPGATRGHLVVERIDLNRFKIVDIFFIEEECFGKFACYKSELKNDCKKFIGEVLDFSEVTLYNNIVRK